MVVVEVEVAVLAVAAAEWSVGKLGRDCLYGGRVAGGRFGLFFGGGNDGRGGSDGAAACCGVVLLSGDGR